MRFDAVEMASKRALRRAMSRQLRCLDDAFASDAAEREAWARPETQRWAWRLIEHGIMLEPDSREPWFLCEAHQDMDMQWLEGICRRAMREVQAR